MMRIKSRGLGPWYSDFLANMERSNRRKNIFLKINDFSETGAEEILNEKRKYIISLAVFADPSHNGSPHLCSGSVWKDSYFVPQWAHLYFVPRWAHLYLIIVSWFHTLFNTICPSIEYSIRWILNTIVDRTLQWIPHYSAVDLEWIRHCSQLGSRVSSPLIFSQAGLTWHLSTGCQTAPFIATPPIPECGIDEEDLPTFLRWMKLIKCYFIRLLKIGAMLQ